MESAGPGGPWIFLAPSRFAAKTPAVEPYVRKRDLYTFLRDIWFFCKAPAPGMAL